MLTSGPSTVKSHSNRRDDVVRDPGLGGRWSAVVVPLRFGPTLGDPLQDARQGGDKQTDQRQGKKDDHHSGDHDWNPLAVNDVLHAVIERQVAIPVAV